MFVWLECHEPLKSSDLEVSPQAAVRQVGVGRRVVELEGAGGHVGTGSRVVQHDARRDVVGRVEAGAGRVGAAAEHVVGDDAPIRRKHCVRHPVSIPYHLYDSCGVVSDRKFSYFDHSWFLKESCQDFLSVRRPRLGLEISDLGVVV